METLQEYLKEYKTQLEKGAIQVAYRGLMEYMMGLRTHFMRSFPNYSVPGSIYYGYMDMTYFSVIPQSLSQRKLKIAIVFLHEAFRFEAWLSGVNRQVQVEYRKSLQESGAGGYRLVSKTDNPDAIIEHTLVADPNFHDLDALTEQIETETLKFIAEMEGLFAARVEPLSPAG